MVSSPGAPRRVHKERVRATRACDRCKLKKARCSGNQPCAVCLNLGLDCQYNASYRRGKLPEIQAIEVPHSLRSSDDNATTTAVIQSPTNAANRSSSDSVPSAYRDEAQEAIEEEETSIIPQVSVGSQRLTRWTSGQNGIPQTSGSELEPHYIGPSSGLSFLLRAQMRLQNTLKSSKDTSIFTFGDAPLPEVDCAFLELPSFEEARSLVATYFDFAFPTHRFLHRPTTEQWLSEFYQNRKRLDLAPGTRERYATVLMILSQAKLYTFSKTGGGPDAEGSAALYAAAEDQLSKETGQIRLTSVQARLAQCFYLLMQSHINRCWNLFGTTARLAIAAGLHRRRRQQSIPDFIVLECRKRVFWCAYSLDIYLSAALGRPRLFHDDDIDQEYPKEVDDQYLFSDSIAQSPAASQHVMTAPLYHARLCKIVSAILREQYGVHRLSLKEQVDAIDRHSKSLLEWRRGIGSFLDGIWTNAALLIPPFSRQCTVLNLAHSHATILTHRPLLLSNFASLAHPPETRDVATQSAIQESNQHCIKAAAYILKIVTDLCERQRMYGAFWFTQYYAFCALVIIYIAVIKGTSNDSADSRTLLRHAQRCQTLLSLPTSQSTFAERYGIVLEELGADAARRIYGFRDTTQNGAELAQHIDVTQNEGVAYLDPHLNPSLVASGFDLEGTGIVFGENYGGLSPSSLLAEMTSWGQFESFVATGSDEAFNPFFAA